MNFKKVQIVLNTHLRQKQCSVEVGYQHSQTTAAGADIPHNTPSPAPPGHGERLDMNYYASEFITTNYHANT